MTDFTYEIIWTSVFQRRSLKLAGLQFQGFKLLLHTMATTTSDKDAAAVSGSNATGSSNVLDNLLDLESSLRQKRRAFRQRRIEEMERRRAQQKQRQRQRHQQRQQQQSGPDNDENDTQESASNTSALSPPMSPSLLASSLPIAPPKKTQTSHGYSSNYRRHLHNNLSTSSPSTSNANTTSAHASPIPKYEYGNPSSSRKPTSSPNRVAFAGGICETTIHLKNNDNDIEIETDVKNFINSSSDSRRLSPPKRINRSNSNSASGNPILPRKNSQRRSRWHYESSDSDNDDKVDLDAMARRRLWGKQAVVAATTIGAAITTKLSQPTSRREGSPERIKYEQVTTTETNNNSRRIRQL